MLQLRKAPLTITILIQSPLASPPSTIMFGVQKGKVTHPLMQYHACLYTTIKNGTEQVFLFLNNSHVKQ
jgi:hypothetical protein